MYFFSQFVSTTICLPPHTIMPYILQILSSKVLEVFTFPSDRVLASIHMWAGLLAALGVISGIAQFLKVRLCVL